jgi:recombination protein RecT
MTEKKDLAKAKETTPAVQENKNTPTHSERFSAMVIKEFSGMAGTVELSSFQRRLIQNYFISIDIALKAAEEKRLKKTGKYQDPLPITWPNINMETLAIRVVACSRIGFDPALPNHINMMPFKNNSLNKYDIVFIEGYRGKEIKAMKYGFEVPTDVVVEVVYSTDVFQSFKKDKNNDVETYIFEIKQPFDRGNIVGGFYYHSHKDNPSKNKLMTFNLAEIEKRKPKYASAEFWGGEKTSYGEDGKKNGTEKVEGWFHEMVWKTIYRAAYGAITIDSQKIDDNFIAMLENDNTYEVHDENPGLTKQATIAEKETVTFTDAVEVKESPEKIGPANTDKDKVPAPTGELFQANVTTAPKAEPGF